MRVLPGSPIEIGGPGRDVVGFGIVARTLECGRIRLLGFACSSEFGQRDRPRGVEWPVPAQPGDLTELVESAQGRLGARDLPERDRG